MLRRIRRKLWVLKERVLKKERWVGFVQAFSSEEEFRYVDCSVKLGVWEDTRGIEEQMEAELWGYSNQIQ